MSPYCSPEDWGISKKRGDWWAVFTVVQWVKDLACPYGGTGSIPGAAQWVKDLGLLQLWHRSHLLAWELPYAVDVAEKDF